MKENKSILTSDETRLRLFDDGININKGLMKWRRAEEGAAKTTQNRNPLEDGESTPFGSSKSGYTNDVDAEISSSTSWLGLYQTPYGVDFDEIAKANIRDLTKILVEKKVKYVMGGYGSFGTTVSNLTYTSAQNNNAMIRDYSTPFDIDSTNNRENKKDGFLKRLFSKKKKPKYEFDALKFFSLVKTTSQESADTYRDRVSDYLKAISNAMITGQISLQEDLLRNLVANKYESLLYAEGYYYVIDEPTMVDFVKRCEKGITIDYVKNYVRPIPDNVVEKINTLNSLEIFDNYVVLHYDPERKSYKETEYERAKRKDPIIFGVIAGSNKLYYITDWIDESCDLTLDKFVDTLSVDKESLKMK